MPITDTTGLMHSIQGEVMENEISTTVSFYVLKLYVKAGVKVIYKPNDNFSLGILNNFEITTQQDSLITIPYTIYIALGEDQPLTTNDLKFLNVKFCELLSTDSVSALVLNGNYSQDNAPNSVERRKPKTISYSKTNNTVSRTAFDIFMDFLICIFIKIRNTINRIIKQLYKIRYIRITK